jgi:hypothetical protein
MGYMIICQYSIIYLFRSWIVLPLNVLSFRFLGESEVIMLLGINPAVNFIVNELLCWFLVFHYGRIMICRFIWDLWYVNRGFEPTCDMIQTSYNAFAKEVSSGHDEASCNVTPQMIYQGYLGNSCNALIYSLLIGNSTSWLKVCWYVILRRWAWLITNFSYPNLPIKV